MKNKFDPRHAMIDLETMGVYPDAAIVSIGIVLFDPRYGISEGDTFYSELDWESQGRVIYPDTEEWWRNQNAITRRALEGLDDLADVLVEVAEFLPKDVKVWGNGPHFDISFMEHAYLQHDIPIPWDFWNVRDCRTIKDLYESLRGGYDKRSGGVLHNALDDAKFQAKYITEMWRSIGKL